METSIRFIVEDIFILQRIFGDISDTKRICIRISGKYCWSRIYTSKIYTSKIYTSKMASAITCRTRTSCRGVVGGEHVCNSFSKLVKGYQTFLYIYLFCFEYWISELYLTRYLRAQDRVVFECKVVIADPWGFALAASTSTLIRRG